MKIFLLDCGKMAAIPQGAFAACKVRYNEERAFSMSTMEGNDKTGKENVFNSRPSLEGNFCSVNISEKTNYKKNSLAFLCLFRLKLTLTIC